MTNKNEVSAHVLSSNLNHDATNDLANFFVTSRGTDVLIDGTKSGPIGALVAQILVVAMTTWATDRMAFHIKDPSGRIAEDLKMLGLYDAMSSALTEESVTA